MNYLQLFQAAARHVGIAEPATTVSPTGESKRLLEFVDEAWLEVQALHNNWNFMWARGSFQLTADKKDFAISTTEINYVNPDSVTLYDASEEDESRILYVPYMPYRRRYDIGTHTAQRPTICTILPNRNIRLHPTPDDTYTIQFDYYKKPTSLSGDTDEPEIPNDDLHWIIVHGAVRRYGDYEEAQLVMAAALLKWNHMLSQLRREELPLVDVQIRPLTGITSHRW